MKEVRVRPGMVFETRRDLARLDEDLRLRNVEWGVLFALTGEHTVAQIGEYFALHDEERGRVFERLLEAGLIVERELTYGEFVRASATIADDEPKSLASFLRVGARPPDAILAPPAEPHDPPAGPREPPAGPREPPDLAQVTRAVPVIRSSARPPAVPFEPLGAPSRLTTLKNATEEPPMVETYDRRLSLKALMQFILERAQDATVGQLDVYRVFIRVSTKLMRRNGIHTLRFEEDHLISDPELQSAILSSVQKTLGLNCPQSVFV